MKVTAIVPAAGTGERFQGDTKKQFLTLAGKPLLAHTLTNLAECDTINEIIVVTHADEIEFCKIEVIGKFGIGKVTAVIAGGETRQESVAKGFGHVSADTSIVAVHDGVRPFATPALIEKTIDAAVKHGAAVAAIKVTDTLKITKDDTIFGSIHRGGVVRVQTPQCFRYAILGEAIEAAERDDFTGTDESSLVERLEREVRIVEGSETNIKITTPEDLRLAEALIVARPPRVG